MHRTNGTRMDVESAAKPARLDQPHPFTSPLWASTNDARSKRIHNIISITVNCDSQYDVSRKDRVESQHSSRRAPTPDP